MPRLLIHERSHDRLRDELKTLVPNLEIVLMSADGGLTQNGQPIDDTNARPDIGWYSIETLLTGQTGRYFKLMKDAGTVKWFQTFHAGVDLPFYQELARQGVRVTRSDAQAVAIAEYTIACVMALYQGVFERRRLQNAHTWRMTGFQELWRKRWLIIGLGNIGRELAKRLAPFECPVIGVRRSAGTDPHADRIVTLAQVPEELPNSDVVVLSCSLTDETRGLAGKIFFERMKKDATLVNIARGGLVDQPALIEALGAGAPARAVLDVFDPEPLPEDSPLWDMANVIVTPHSSNAGSGTRLRNDRIFMENLARYLSGQPLKYEATDELRG